MLQPRPQSIIYVEYPLKLTAHSSSSSHRHSSTRRTRERRFRRVLSIHGQLSAIPVVEVNQRKSACYDMQTDSRATVVVRSDGLLRLTSSSSRGKRGPHSALSGTISNVKSDSLNPATSRTASLLIRLFAVLMNIWIRFRSRSVGPAFRMDLPPEPVGTKMYRRSCSPNFSC